LLNPEQYSTTPVYDLLEAAAKGQVGFDHRLLHAIVDRGEASVPELLKWGLEEHEDNPIDLEEDVINILHYLRTPEAVPFFVHCIRLHPDDVSDELGAALYGVRQHAVEPLLSLYSELEEEQSGEVAFILASFRIMDPRILAILTDRLEYDAADGAIGLGLYGDPAAKPALEKMLAAVDPAESNIVRDITDAIEQLGRPVDEAPIEFDLWEEYPEKTGPHFELLDEEDRLSMLGSDSAEVRAEAVSSFVNRDLSDVARKRIFEMAKADPDVMVRANAWEAMSDELDNSHIRNSMFERLSDRDAPIEERCGALIGLAQQAGKPDIRTFAEEFYQIKECRAKALEAMWRSLDRSFAEYFPQHLDDAESEVRRHAIWGIGYLGIYASAEKLTKFFDDEDLRADALFAYALSVRHEISKARIRGLLRKIEELAGGLTEGETELVQLALDERLTLHGHSAVFFPDVEPQEPDLVAKPAAAAVVAGRNDPCPCGSGKKFKKCCGAAA
jgi:HEAT repeat protein